MQECAIEHNTIDDTILRTTMEVSSDIEDNNGDINFKKAKISD